MALLMTTVADAESASSISVWRVEPPAKEKTRKTYTVPETDVNITIEDKIVVESGGVVLDAPRPKDPKEMIRVTADLTAAVMQRVAVKAETPPKEETSPKEVPAEKVEPTPTAPATPKVDARDSSVYYAEGNVNVHNNNVHIGGGKGKRKITVRRRYFRTEPAVRGFGAVGLR